jgi:hypothetical protein
MSYLFFLKIWRFWSFFFQKKTFVWFKAPFFLGSPTGENSPRKKTLVFRQSGSTHSHVQGSMDERPSAVFRIPNTDGCSVSSHVVDVRIPEDACALLSVCACGHQRSPKNSHDQSQRNTLKWVCSRSVFLKQKSEVGRLPLMHERT